MIRLRVGGAEAGDPPGRPNRLAYELLDLRTGRPLRSATTEVEAASWEGVAWSDDAV